MALITAKAVPTLTPTLRLRRNGTEVSSNCRSDVAVPGEGASGKPPNAAKLNSLVGANMGSVG